MFLIQKIVAVRFKSRENEPVLCVFTLVCYQPAMCRLYSRHTAFPSLFWILRENAAENSWPEDEILKFQIQEGIMSPLMTKKCMGTCSIWCVVPPGNGVFPRVESCVTLYSVCASRVSTNQSVSRVSRDGTGRGTPKHLQNLGIPLCVGARGEVWQNLS